MQTWRFTLQPNSAFATPLLGDTLFGQLCWTVLYQHGEEQLNRLLASYRTGSPFCVLSDAFPTGYVPRPHLPLFALNVESSGEVAARKQWKSKQWMPLKDIQQPLTQWLQYCESSDSIYRDNDAGSRYQQSEGRMHNSINRITGTTGEGGFAPYAVAQTWFHPQAELDVYATIDESCFTGEDLIAALNVIGATGFGKDASVGLGRFAVVGGTQVLMPHQTNSTAWMTLAACAPQQQGFIAQKSFWQPFTRYGRHGAIAAVSGRPFKAPVLLARAGSVFTPPRFTAALYIGQGLGGDGSLSKAIPATVQQGYAPVIGLDLTHVQARIAAATNQE